MNPLCSAAGRKEESGINIFLGYATGKYPGQFLGFQMTASRSFFFLLCMKNADTAIFARKYWQGFKVFKYGNRTYGTYI